MSRVLELVAGLVLLVFGGYWLLIALLLSTEQWLGIFPLVYSTGLAVTGAALLFPRPIRERWYLFATFLPLIPFALAGAFLAADGGSFSLDDFLSAWLPLVALLSPSVLAGIAWLLVQKSSKAVI